MFRNKTVLIFLLKLLLYCGILAAPLPFYDELYGRFYRYWGQQTFEKFRGDGFVLFREGTSATITEVVMGNYQVRNPNNTARGFKFKINHRYLGYLPTILFISLVLASPVSWKRKIFALVIGLTLVTAAVLFKQWIELLAIADKQNWLKLTDFSPGQKKWLMAAYNGISRAASSLLYLVVALWLSLTFRLDDLKSAVRKVTETPKKETAPEKRTVRK